FVLVPRGRQELQYLVTVIDGSGHEIGRLAAGVAEHDALVARALGIAVGGPVDAFRDIGRLAVGANLDPRGLPVEAFLLVADRLDRLARRGLELGRIDDFPAVLVLLHEGRRYAYLACDDHPVGRGKRLAGDADVPGVHPGLLGLPVDQIDDLVGYAIADLVRMAFGYGFAGEEIFPVRHG